MILWYESGTHLKSKMCCISPKAARLCIFLAHEAGLNEACANELRGGSRRCGEKLW